MATSGGAALSLRRSAALPPPSVRTLERLSLAYDRANTVFSRPTSVAASEFFEGAHVIQDGEEWKTLPRRLARLRDRFISILDRNIDPNNRENLNSEEKENVERHRVDLISAVIAVAPPSFLNSFQVLFSKALRARQRRWEVSNLSTLSDVEEEVDECGMKSEGELPFDECAVYSALHTLGWLPSSKLMNKPLAHAMQDVIERTIRTKISGEYDEYGMLDAVNSWKRDVLKPWLLGVVLANDGDGKENSDNNKDNDGWGRKLDFAVAESFVQVRQGELFDIVADYPDSHPAVEELRDALNVTHVHEARLASSLRESLQRRLLHPGANTGQILDVYISTIKVLSVIDPSDGLLEYVAEPVRKYLQSRSDTVRCIITGLTDADSGGDLYEELRRQDAKPLEQAPDSDDEEEMPSPDWQPASSHQNQVISSPNPSLRGVPSCSRSGDILAMLVGIYGSQELFVNEYRIMLADKLLANLTFDTENEVHTLELLKLRFGEASMRQCEIMIKDIDDSKRIVSNILSTLKTKEANKRETISSRQRRRQLIAPSPMETDEEVPVVDAAILSHIFWPTLLKDDLKVHPRIQEQLDRFGKEYANLKNPRRLIWLGQLGTVELELELDGDEKPREFSCSPLHATLISHFEDKDEWTVADLSNETGVGEDVIRRKMGYWLNHRVVSCVTGNDGGLVYNIAASHELPASPTAAASSMSYEDDDHNVARSTGDPNEEEMKVYESYIVGMLTNLGPLPLERIHNMLKMFVRGSDHKYDKVPQELSVFLQHLCKEDKLECTPDGTYKLLKK